MPKSDMGLTPGGRSVLDLEERTGVPRLVARRLVNLSGILGRMEARSRDFW